MVYPRLVLCSILLLSTLSSCSAVPPPSPPFYCDMLTYLADKQYVESRADLLGGRKSLRIATVGVSADAIRQALDTQTCSCTRRPFDPEHRQPHRPAALVATWLCAPDQIEISEFSSSATWSAPQVEEFVARISAHARWSQPLDQAGWPSGPGGTLTRGTTDWTTNACSP